MSCHYWQSTQGVRVKSACGPMSASVGADIREDLDLILGAFNAGGGGGRTLPQRDVASLPR